MIWNFGVVVVLVLVSSPVSRSQEQWTSDLEDAAIEVFNQCRCVPSTWCDPITNTIIANRSLIQPRLTNQNVPAIQCKSSKEKVCCKEAPKKNDQQVTARGSGLTMCGVRNLTVQWKINEDNALPPIDGEFPWTAVILENNRYTNAGSLIHPKVVLTACHNVFRKNPKSLTVVVSDKVKRNQFFRGETRRVSEIICHDGYDNATLVYDVALLILETPFKGSPFTPLCLPPADVKLEGTKCLISVWGQDDDGNYLEDMKKIELPFVNHDRCQTLLRNTRLGEYFILNESFLCAGGEEERDACDGDGGSALMCPMFEGSNQYFQAGLVSWGIDCGEKDVPGVYANLQEVSFWIKQKLKLKTS